MVTYSDLECRQICSKRLRWKPFQDKRCLRIAHWSWPLFTTPREALTLFSASNSAWFGILNGGLRSERTADRYHSQPVTKELTKGLIKKHKKHVSCTPRWVTKLSNRDPIQKKTESSTSNICSKTIGCPGALACRTSCQWLSHHCCVWLHIYICHTVCSCLSKCRNVSLSNDAFDTIGTFFGAWKKK